MEVHLCCFEQRWNLQCFCPLGSFAQKTKRSAHTRGQVAGAWTQDACIGVRTHIALGPDRLQTTAQASISVHFYFVAGKFATAQDATSKIEVILSMNFKFLNSRQLNFIQYVSPSCSCNAFPCVQRPKFSHGTQGSYVLPCPLAHIPEYCVINFYRL